MLINEQFCQILHFHLYLMTHRSQPSQRLSVNFYGSINYVFGWTMNRRYKNCPILLANLNNFGFFYFWTKRFKLNQCAVGKMALTTCWGLNIIEKIAKSRFGYPRVCYLWSVVKSTIYLRMYPMDQLFCDKRTNAHSNDWIWPQWYNTDKKERTYVDIWLIYNLATTL